MVTDFAKYARMEEVVDQSRFLIIGSVLRLINNSRLLDYFR